MRRRFFLLTCLLTAGLFHAAAEDRPNILWITAEDMSPALGCYGDEYAITPNIDQLASESVRYTHAFATAPVCSPSRSCLITGCYAPSLGTQQMRSAFPIPRWMTGFPAILRKETGYFTTNNVKTDYNTANWEQIIAASWDESSAEAHWRKRPDKSKPFFSIFNLMTSHQSRTMVWPYEKFVAEVQSKLEPDEIHDPAKAPLPPYYVDTPIVRRDWARFYDCVTAMDKEVGAILQQLEEDGLADDTIVFFYSDHGSGMPRHKRALFDSGMHVPLLIRFPEKYADWAPAKPGESINRLVSFVDFGPTALSLAGAEIPDFMQGGPFLGGQESEPRSLVFGHRDRVDEVRDLTRSVRDHRFLYIRNYMPHLGYNQPTSWPDSGDIRHEFYRLTDKEKMTDAQWQFAGPTRPVEEFYDCEADPLNLNNLAESPEHRETLERLRKAHRKHLRDSRDLGFLPESVAWINFEGTTGWTSGKDLNLDAGFRAADAVGTADEPVWLEFLASRDPAARYWGAVALGAHKAKSMRDVVSKPARKALERALKDDWEAVRIEAANALCQNGQHGIGLPVLIAELESDNFTSVLHAARTIELLGEDARTAISAMEKLLARCHEIRPPDTPPTVVASGREDLAMFTAMSVSAFLENVGEEEDDDEVGAALFDGKTLNGWTALAEGDVNVTDGEIQILAKGKNLWLLHEKEFENFELTAEVKMPDDSYNSGIGFRCTPAKGKPKGYQCEVAGNITGKIYGIGAGWIWPKGKEEEKRFREMAGESFDPDDWNAIRIRCEGDHIQIWVNDTLTADVRDSTFVKGVVALQHHGKGGVHRFRSIRIQELP